jgi:heat-inducible transcriptional repressor
MNDHHSTGRGLTSPEDPPHSETPTPLDERARILLKTLVENYISEGAPVGSRILSRASGLDLSAATVRNVMADLEDLGFIASPHTSAGRIPTPRGYRFFVDSLLTMQPLEQIDQARIVSGLSGAQAQPGQIISQASRLLSDLTHFAGIVIAPRHASTRIRQVEFISLADRRVLLVLVTSDGNVQNRILTTDRPYSPGELLEAANTLNQNFVGLELEQMRHRVHDELTRIRADMQALMAAALTASSEALMPRESDTIISGEKNLLDVEDLSSNMRRLRELFDLFEQRTSLARLLDLSQRAAGVRLYIGQESGIATLDECSVVTAPYQVEGEVVGSVGVIGPTRMAYDRVIPIVDITARLLSSALTEQAQS